MTYALHYYRFKLHQQLFPMAADILDTSYLPVLDIYYLSFDFFVRFFDAIAGPGMDAMQRGICFVYLGYMCPDLPTQLSDDCV